jgi:short-subunit dehydrogenase
LPFDFESRIEFKRAMKRVIIIGATSGIGRQLAKLFVDAGFIVGATGRRKHLLEELKSEHPEKIFISAFDITDTDTVPEKLAVLVKEIGGLDLLVLSSGTGHVNHALDFVLEREAIDTNVLGFTRIADWTFDFFQKQRSGQFVGISSIAGIRGGRHAPAYNASKAYQISYMDGLRHKAAKLKLPIVITDIRAGFIETSMAKDEGAFWIAPVEKASRQIYRAIEKKKPVAYVTKRWVIIALLLRLVPRTIYQRI